MNVKEKWNLDGKTSKHHGNAWSQNDYFIFGSKGVIGDG